MTTPTIDIKRTGKQIRRYMERRGLSVNEVRDYLSIGSVQSVYHWLAGESLPSTDNLYALSVLLQVPMDELIVGVDIQSVSEEVSKQHKRLLYYYKACSIIAA